MKALIKISILAITALALATSSYADAVRPQSANQPDRQSVALLASGTGAGAAASEDRGAVKIASRGNAHGQTVVEFVK